MAARKAKVHTSADIQIALAVKGVTCPDVLWKVEGGPKVSKATPAE